MGRSDILENFIQIFIRRINCYFKTANMQKKIPVTSEKRVAKSLKINSGKIKEYIANWTEFYFY